MLFRPFKIGGVDDGIQQLLPEAAIPPAARASIGCSSSLRNRVAGPPKALPGTQDPEHRVQKQAVVPDLCSAFPPSPGNMGCHVPPHTITRYPKVYHQLRVWKAIANNPNVEKSTVSDWLPNQTRFSGKEHRGSPASGRVITKMPEADAPSQARRRPNFGRYLPLSGPPRLFLQ